MDDEVLQNIQDQGDVLLMGWVLLMGIYIAGEFYCWGFLQLGVVSDGNHIAMGFYCLGFLLIGDFYC